MKVGDQLVVRMDRFEVAMATIEEIEDGKAIISIPATRVVMGIATSLEDLTPETEQGVLDGHPLESRGPENSTAAEEVNTGFSSAPELSGETSLRDMQFDTSAID